jgi:hypothetical protein
MISLVDWFINRLFSNRYLREAIFSEVHFYDMIEERLKEPTTTLSWEENGLWYGYTYNEMHKTYLFDDIGHESLSDLWEGLWTRDMEWGLMYR